MTSYQNIIEVYCTRPSCESRSNYISEDKIALYSIRQQYCSNCKMPLIVCQHFLPFKLLVPDEERHERGGGFGRTFLAKDMRSPKQMCVIKQLAPLQQSELQTIERLFRQEAEVLKKLSHDQIPKELEFGVLKAPTYTQNSSDKTSNNVQNFFYLVQEFIEGKNLDDELEEKGKFDEEEVIDFLLQTLNILDYIHNKRISDSDGIIHRDIKPRNIIRRSSDKKFCLIDFGSVKQVVAGVPTDSSCVLGTKDYAAPEQWAGEKVFYSSDLYSLAATCICLLTGKSPKELRHGNKWIWRPYANLKNNRLADILDLILLPDPTGRPQSAQEVIKAFPDDLTVIVIPSQELEERTEQESIPSRLKYAIVSAVLLVSIVFSCGIVWWLNRPICISNENFSCGDKRLIPTSQEKMQSQDFKNGVKAFKERNYSEAFKDLEKHLAKQKNDPEARVYYNNAKAVNHGKFVKIAVCLPITGDANNRNYSDGIAEEILRGVALVQNNINSYQTRQNLIQGEKMLFIQICDDDNDINKAEMVANIIVNDSSIKGVIGHYPSLTTLAAGKIYNKKIPAISPMSSAVRDQNNFPLSDYIFRVSVDDSYTAEKLVKYIIDKRFNRVAIMYDSGDNFTRSLGEQFRHKLNSQGNSQRIVSDCDIKKYPTISACINEAKSNNAQVILLAITNKLVEENTDVWNLFISPPENMVLIGGSSLYSVKSRTRNLQNKLILALQWHKAGEDSDIKRRSFQLWGTQNINLRTAMGYEAAQSMIQALTNIEGDITSQKLYNALRDLKGTDNFPAKGAIVNVEFDARSDRKVDATNKDKLMFIVTPQNNPSTGQDDFLPPNN